MSEIVRNFSTVEFQRSQIKDVLIKNLVEGESWYLVDTRWYRRFEAYMEGATEYPGPINNSSLFKTENCGLDIKDNLVDNIDYVLVPEKAWKLLVGWYGIIPGQEAIKKKVIQYGLFVKRCMVEVYFTKVRLCNNFDSNMVHFVKFSSGASIGYVKEFAKNIFRVPKTKKTKLLTCYTEYNLEELDKDTMTIKDAYLQPMQILILEHRDDDSSDVLPGLTGLRNLGFTCFMNSVIQCMSHCPPIVRYFVNEEYRAQINATNPEGMKGELAKEFAELIKTLWSSEHQFVSPNAFRDQVVKFAPQFSNYNQQDVQEFLMVLLDGLHEDLKRIMNEPYIEYSNFDGCPEDEVAQKTWENYRKRNDSIIIDLFHGLLKSSRVCPDCNNGSIKFDPFCYLVLPLPPPEIFYVILVSLDPNKALEKFRLPVPANSCVGSIISALSSFTGIAEDFLVLAAVEMNHFYAIFGITDSITTIDKNDALYAYQLAASLNDPAFMTLPVRLSLGDDSDNGDAKNSFGLPFFVTVRLDVNYCELYDALLNCMKRFWNKNASIIKKETPNFDGDRNVDGTENSAVGTETDVNVTDFPPFYIYISDGCETGELFKLHNDDKEIILPSMWQKSLSDSMEHDAENSLHLVLKWIRSTLSDWSYNDGGFEKVSWHKSYYRSIRHTPKLQLEDCLNAYTACEKLNDSESWYCSTCEKYQCATTKIDLWSLPSVLIIYLKRFSNSKSKSDKIKTLVEFPLKGLDLSEYVIGSRNQVPVYDLMSVCNHHGCLNSGHYTAHALNNFDGKWYRFDDSKVSAIDETSVVTNDAYVLFYIRRDDNMDFNLSTEE